MIKLPSTEDSVLETHFFWGLKPLKKSQLGSVFEQIILYQCQFSVVENLLWYVWCFVAGEDGMWELLVLFFAISCMYFLNIIKIKRNSWASIEYGSTSWSMNLILMFNIVYLNSLWVAITIGSISLFQVPSKVSVVGHPQELFTGCII